MLNEKELIVYETIKKYFTKYQRSPSIRELCELLNYKSTKTISSYLKKLRDKKYIEFENKKKRTIKINNQINTNIKVINNNQILNINNDNTILFQIKNNYFNNLLIKKNDYLIIKLNTQIKDGNLGLFYINNEYRIMSYRYYDGYYILEDNEKEYLYKIELIGKVIGIYRNII